MRCKFFFPVCLLILLMVVLKKKQSKLFVIKHIPLTCTDQMNSSKSKVKAIGSISQLLCF